MGRLQPSGRKSVKVTLKKETLYFRCNKSQITGLKKFQFKYFLIFGNIVRKIRALKKLKTMSEIQSIMQLTFFFQMIDQLFDFCCI